MQITIHDLIFNSTNDGMIVIDNDENMILLNKSAEKMIGANRNEWGWKAYKGGHSDQSFTAGFTD